jgi:hypothetical protein
VPFSQYWEKLFEREMKLLQKKVMKSVKRKSVSSQIKSIKGFSSNSKNKVKKSKKAGARK